MSLYEPKGHTQYFHFHDVHQNFDENWLINECALKKIFKRALCDLQQPLRSYFIHEFSV